MREAQLHNSCVGAQPSCAKVTCYSPLTACHISPLDYYHLLPLTTTHSPLALLTYYVFTSTTKAVQRAGTYLVYTEAVQTFALTLRDVSPVPPMALMLFGGRLSFNAKVSLAHFGFRHSSEVSFAHTMASLWLCCSKCSSCFNVKGHLARVRVRGTHGSPSTPRCRPLIHLHMNILNGSA